MLRAALVITTACFFLAACGVSHGPVSGGTLRRLQSQAVTVGEARSMLRGDHFDTRSSPPGPTLRIPMRRDHAGLPHVDASINGRPPTRLLFDTGATVTVLSADLAMRSDLATVPGAKPQMQGVIGKEAGMGGVIERLQIGDWQLENLPCVIRLQRSSGGIDYLGQDFDISVLGFHLAQKYCSYITFDYPRGEIELGFGQRFSGPRLAKHVKSSYKLQQGVPMTRLTTGKVSWDAIVDTGSAFGVEIDQKLAARLGHATGGTAVDAPFVMIGVGGTTTPQKAGVRIITVPGLRMLGHEFKKAQLDVMPGMPRIGSFFLKDFRVTFDIRRQLIWLEW